MPNCAAIQVPKLKMTQDIISLLKNSFTKMSKKTEKIALLFILLFTLAVNHWKRSATKPVRHVAAQFGRGYCT